MRGAPRDDLAALVKALPLRLTAPFADRARHLLGRRHRLGRGGRRADAARHPGVFACGEMLDWEAPTGGYLLQACFATGRAAGRAAAA